MPATPPVTDPFSTFIGGGVTSPAIPGAPIGGQMPITPPTGIQLPPNNGAPIDTWGPGGNPALNNPLTLTPAAQSPLGGNGNAPPIVAPGGADYPAITNDATGRLGDSPFRRIKRGSFQAVPQNAPAAVPPTGMRII